MRVWQARKKTHASRQFKIKWSQVRNKANHLEGHWRWPLRQKGRMTLSNRSEGRNWFSHHDTFALNPRELQKLRENQWSPSLLLDYASIVFLIFNILLILSIQLWINGLLFYWLIYSDRWKNFALFLWKVPNRILNGENHIVYTHNLS